MIVWDRGIYRSRDGRSPADGLAKGKLDLELDGHKLRGRFALVRTKRGAGREWLFFAKRAAGAEGAELIEREPASVFSGLTVRELATGVALDAELEAAAAARRARLARALDAATLRPMLAAADDEPFRRARLAVRAQVRRRARARREARRARPPLRAQRRRAHARSTRRSRTRSATCPIEDAILDGEIVAIDALGRSSLRAHPAPLHAERSGGGGAGAARGSGGVLCVRSASPSPATTCASSRSRSARQLLARLAPRTGFIRFADHVEERRPRARSRRRSSTASKA